MGSRSSGGAGPVLSIGALSRATGVPVFLADVIQGAALVTMLAALMLTQYRIRWDRPAHE